MKNIAGILAYTTEENFKNEGRPEKWTDLADITKENRRKQHKYPGQILQVEGNLASSINTQYDDNSAVIGSNLPYAARRSSRQKQKSKNPCSSLYKPY